MALAKRATDAMGARLLFVYLRDYRVYGDAIKWGRLDDMRRSILDTVGRLGIDRYDTWPEVKAEFEDPRAMHRRSSEHPLTAPGNLSRHYNSAGHRFVGRSIARRVARDALLSDGPERPAP
jgi:hypothetical protein